MPSAYNPHIRQGSRLYGQIAVRLLKFKPLYQSPHQKSGREESPEFSRPYDGGGSYRNSGMGLRPPTTVSKRVESEDFDKTTRRFCVEVETIFAGRRELGLHLWLDNCRPIVDQL